MKKVCVLLPALNEAKHIEFLIAQISKIRVAGCSIYPLVIDDGSTDQTAVLAKKAGATVISHEKNRGVGAAFRTGLQWAKDHEVDYLIHMDSDGQVPPQEIPHLLVPVLNGEADIALASRFLQTPPENLARWQAFALRIAARTIGFLTGARITDLSCGFRCMNRFLIERLHPGFDYDYIQESLIQAISFGARIIEVPANIFYPVNSSKKAMSQRTIRYGCRFLFMTAHAMVQFYVTKIQELFK